MDALEASCPPTAVMSSFEISSSSLTGKNTLEVMDSALMVDAELPVSDEPVGRCSILPGPPHVKNIIVTELCERYGSICLLLHIRPNRNVSFSGFAFMGKSRRLVSTFCACDSRNDSSCLDCVHCWCCSCGTSLISRSRSLCQFTATSLPCRTLRL